MSVYYNDNDPQSAAWLRELIKAGHLPEGDVDERSILEVEPADVVDYTQVHFFAGVGGWPYALQLAGWPADRPVWTGSPPCQPFSVAGQQKGQADERHLAPHWIDLVAACRPPVLFGEQVASSAVFGKVAKRAGRGADGTPEWAWLDDLQGRLEAAHYAVGATGIPAAAVGAPHLRQRTFFGAYDLRSAAGGLEHDAGIGWQQWRSEPEGRGTDRLAHSAGAGRRQAGRDTTGNRETDGGWTRNRNGDGSTDVLDARVDEPAPAGPVNGFWQDADWLYCTDGKWRPVEPGLEPLAHGVPGRVGLLRGYGNAIVPQVAAAFIMSFEAAREEVHDDV